MNTVPSVAAPATLERINVMKPWLGEEEAQAIAEVVASGWVAQGPRTAAFEAAFAKHQMAAHAVATSSCTTALHLALLVAGVKAGDDVLVPSFSFIATANAPTYVGAHPVFVDVEPGTGNVTVETLERGLTVATTAVIVVDQGGIPVDLSPIRHWCDSHGLKLIEDAACAAGSTYRGEPVGRGADVSAWSFHPRKLLTTGEGGMLTTNNEAWAARARTLREHAMGVSAAERHSALVAPAESYAEIGYNYRMTDLQAAMGLVQLGKLDAMVARRRELVQRYRDALEVIAGLELVRDPEHGTSNFQSCWLEVLPEYPLDREGLLEHLGRLGISARRGIMAAHQQPAYAHVASGGLPVTDRLTRNTLILPLYHQLSDTDQQRVIDALANPKE
ncbi:DegT/DnrJ/EryC1/StrS family aminotransferase [Paeniglutamicibacter psychrophenolicus]|uniref:dTDP-4-amino-4,6-dideoxygalactose transaminase n=1 Tax=Paeniglutamicibacter psychrophenolicus TaxID=257454 RepID=A0ABS4WIS1_9MICC|nr:DegT/DnrJ/EryC1/StrS family aminotransferase [Paeniglutamicibacter psychrophenolicus]MBP2375926.1 dTDP-4-amino-4,6-dideoxygalactose transaminase [Paeniglutamicibacter psychrophenolicus]